MLPEALKEAPPAAALEAHDPGAIVGGAMERDQVVLEIAPEAIVGACRFLQQHEQFNRLAGVTAVDWYPQKPRFQVIYLLHSMARNQRLRLSCRPAGEVAEIESVTGVWAGANWYEREVFDLFGIVFRNHPDLRRIMMPDDWQGYPLRKDYPVHGHKYSYQDES
jgi:NADH-quinone oxidoreductase subunit C